jgi:hypothetical protein
VNTSTPQNEKNHKKPSLLERIKGTPTEDIAGGVQKTEKLTKADVDKNSRNQRILDAQTIGKIRRFMYWVVFLVFVAFVLQTGWLFGGWVNSFASDMVAVKAYLSSIFNYILIIFATLFVENMVRGKDH